jgi:hypothetical protein
MGIPSRHRDARSYAGELAEQLSTRKAPADVKRVQGSILDGIEGARKPAANSISIPVGVQPGMKGQTPVKLDAGRLPIVVFQRGKF